MRDLAIICAIALTFGAGCEAERPGGDKPDAGVPVPDMLEAPTLDTTVPMSTPNDFVAVRGTSAGSRVIVKGPMSGDPIVRAVLPTGGFCAEVPLLASGPTMLTAYSLKDGAVSPAVNFTVTKDPGAPIPQSPRCLGMEEPVCVAETAAACTNEKDDDCNGFTDECDPGCNGCADDALGPNWVPFFVPMVAAGTYQLQMCPCRVDWFAFYAMTGERVHARATFSTANIDIDMRLQTPQAAEDNLATAVATSTTTTGIENIDWTATATGMYYLKVYTYGTKNVGPYTLTIY